VASRIKPLTLYTIGHGTVGIETFIHYLRDAEIASLVDVRRFPGSRRHPQFGSAPLASALREAGIAYRHVEDLGGRRRPIPGSENAGLRNEGFRGYADWMQGDAFAKAFSDVMNEANARRTVVMCAETPWWKCHRRLIADAAVLLDDASVEHLVGGKVTEHRLTPGVVAENGRLLYR
jgi:uncharacterized protein (DUF488 family)